MKDQLRHDRDLRFFSTFKLNLVLGFRFWRLICVTLRLVDEAPLHCLRGLGVLFRPLNIDDFLIGDSLSSTDSNKIFKDWRIVSVSTKFFL